MAVAVPHGPANCALLHFPPTTSWNLTGAEMNMMNRLGDRLNGVIQDAVTAAGNRYGRIRYVDVRPLFAGHGMCAVPSPWIRALFPDNYSNEAAHPNSEGWWQEADFLARTFWGNGQG
nr:hypothetical protein GCM10020063_008140 [Dactylosporangium thailandense]